MRDWKPEPNVLPLIHNCFVMQWLILIVRHRNYWLRDIQDVQQTRIITLHIAIDSNIQPINYVTLIIVCALCVPTLWTTAAHRSSPVALTLTIICIPNFATNEEYSWVSVLRNNSFIHSLVETFAHSLYIIFFWTAYVWLRERARLPSIGSMP